MPIQTQLENLKLRLQIPQTDDTKDALLLSYLDEARAKILNYLCRNDIPPELETTLISIAVRLVRLNDPALRLAVSETQGARSVKFAETKEETESLLCPYYRELNRHRKTRIL